MRHTAPPQQETRAHPQQVCHLGPVLGLAAFVTVVKQAEAAVMNGCDEGSCLTLRSAWGHSPTRVSESSMDGSSAIRCSFLLSSILTSFFFLSLFSPTEDSQPVQYKTLPAPKPPRTVPPYNGFGSEEDSLGSCLNLLPKPPKKDFRKFMEKDRLDEL